MDVTIFAQYIVPTLNITIRYVGEEPYCLVTKSYNQAMKDILLSKGIKLIVIPRKENEGVPISASKVRELLKEGQFEELTKFIPKTTYNFLKSKKASPIIEKIKVNNQRH